MSYVSEKVRFQFETLPIELKNYILEKGVVLNSMEDLIKALEEVAQEETDTRVCSHYCINQQDVI